MPKRSTLRLTKRIVDGFKPGRKDAISRDRDLAGNRDSGAVPRLTAANDAHVPGLGNHAEEHLA